MIHGDCMDALPQLLAEGVLVDAVVCDPPYGLAFMGRQWDAPDNVAFRPETWAAMREGFRAILIEREAEYVADINRRLAHVKGEDAPLFGGGA